MGKNFLNPPGAGRACYLVVKTDDSIKMTVVPVFLR